MILALAALLAAAPQLQAIAHDYYSWRDRGDPVNSSDQGLHTWDAELSDPAAFRDRRKHVEELLAQVKELPAEG